MMRRKYIHFKLKMYLHTCVYSCVCFSKSIYVCLYVHMVVCTHEYMCVTVKIFNRLFSSIMSHPILEIASHIELGSHCSS